MSPSAPVQCYNDVRVLAGLLESCPICQPIVDVIRPQMGWVKMEGTEFWMNAELPPEQSDRILDAINHQMKRGIRTAIQIPPEIKAKYQPKTKPQPETQEHNPT